MSMEQGPDYSHSHEQSPGLLLMAYLKGQFDDAIQKEKSEFVRHHEEDYLNGSFIRRNPTDQGHILVKGSRSILLKPPHPNDIPGFHCIVYALRFDEGARALPGEEYMEGVQHYLLRDFTNGRGGPFWMIDETGAVKVDVDIVGEMDFGESEEARLLNAAEVARNMYIKYSGYNIVASAG